MISLCTPSRSRSCTFSSRIWLRFSASSCWRLRFSSATATVSATASVNSRSSGSVGRAGVGRIQMDHAEHFAVAADRGADHARGQDVALAVAAAELAVVHHVAGEHGLAVAHHGRRQELRHAMVAVRRIAPRGDHFQVVGRSAWPSAGGPAAARRRRRPASLRTVRRAPRWPASRRRSPWPARTPAGTRLAAARPTFGSETSTSSSSGGSRKRLCPRRCVIVVGS